MYESSSDQNIKTLIHDARGPLNRISMNAELIKLIVENDMPKEKAIEALNKIITACQDCSEKLQTISDSHQ